jgi:hypothetical protein
VLPFWILFQRLAGPGCGRAAFAPADWLRGGEGRAKCIPFTDELYGSVFQQTGFMHDADSSKEHGRSLINQGSFGAEGKAQLVVLWS